MTVEEDLFRSAFRSSPIGMAVLAEDGTIVDANPALAHLLGRDAADLVGRPFTEYTHPDDLARDEEAFSQLTSEALGHYQIHKRYVDGQGNTVWARVTVSQAGLASPDSPQRFVSQVEDLTEARRIQTLLEERSLYDQLTGLPNATFLLDRLGHALARHASSPTRVAVLMCDIDHFSVINDSLGHRAGNALLAAVARRIQGATSPGSTVARHASDEFLVVLEDVGGANDALAAAEAIAQAVRSPLTLADHEIVPTLSIGISLSEGATSAEALVRDADTAMFAAKEAGRSRIEVFRPDLRVEALNRLTIEADLRAAVREGTLVVHYQPIVDLENRGVYAYEALVRWEHPDRGLLLPDEFIEISEKANLVASLGSWVLEEACAFVARHPEYDGRIFVNVSTRQIGSADLAHFVTSALDSTGVDPHRLCLEITETGVLLATDATRIDLENVASLGIELVLDDFGEGYSALSAILQNPVAGLKLSKEYADRLGDPSGDRVSSAIALLTERLGIMGIIEGIETEDQHDRALAHGWRYGQGYLYGRPLPEADLPFGPPATGGPDEGAGE